MKLYKLTQDANPYNWDIYDGVIVCEKDEENAVLWHPGGVKSSCDENGKLPEHWYDNWVNDIKHIKCEYIGTAARGMKAGVVLASFNAG